MISKQNVGQNNPNTASSRVHAVWFYLYKIQSKGNTLVYDARHNGYFCVFHGRWWLEKNKMRGVGDLVINVCFFDLVNGYTAEFSLWKIIEFTFMICTLFFLYITLQ